MGTTRLWVACAGVLLALVALVDVTITNPPVTVRWRADTSREDRVALERRYGLRNGEPDKNSPETWQYTLGDRSRENIRALVQDPAAADTGYIDRESLTPRSRGVRVTIRRIPPFSLPSLPFPLNADGPVANPRERARFLPSLWLLMAGGAVLWTAGAASTRRRRNVTVGALLLVGVLASAFPLSPSFVRMGDARELAQSREGFEFYAGVNRIRFEAHLSYAILGQIDRLFGQTQGAPERAFSTLSRGATGWFVLSALAIGVFERWSPLVLRYLGLALLAPSALMYFGWRDFGFLSLNVAAYPLLARGLRDGGWRLEGGSALTGLGAALHGFGLVSLIGAWIAALATRARFIVRAGRLLRIAAWGTAAYIGWIAIYIIVLKLPIATGNAETFPWRHWFVEEIRDGRVNAAIFSATGARDLLMTGWVVGAALLIVAASLWREYRDEVGPALAYALPSVIFTILVWPIQGLGEGMHLVFARFSAAYALSWVCAHDPTRTKVAAALLVSAHLAFWRIVLDPQFANGRID